MTARAIDRPVKREPDIVVRGHQWWWEVEYPGRGLTTANEIHIPVGRDMLIAVETADVIHDFWVPELGRKMDAIPGQRNFIWIRAGARGLPRGVRGVLRSPARMDALPRHRCRNRRFTRHGRRAKLGPR